MHLIQRKNDFPQLSYYTDRPTLLLSRPAEYSDEIIMSSYMESRNLYLPYFWWYIEERLITVIYGSNLIESAGSSLEITTELCKKVFRGEGDTIKIDIDEDDATYDNHLEALSATSRKADKENVIRSRKEVIFHAKALTFMIYRIVEMNEVWSEDIIRETHRILYQGLEDTEGDVTPGVYRIHEVAVAYGDMRKRRICLRASALHEYMANMVSNIEYDMSKVEAYLEPHKLAARYHHQFAMIHPFGDGNGRMTRIIMNVLLLKHAGQVAPIGYRENDKQEYLDIMGRASKIFNTEDMEIDFMEQTCHYEFAEYIKVISRPR